jgi:hypothetical protein
VSIRARFDHCLGELASIKVHIALNFKSTARGVSLLNGKVGPPQAISLIWNTLQVQAKAGAKMNGLAGVSNACDLTQFPSDHGNQSGVVLFKLLAIVGESFNGSSYISAASGHDVNPQLKRRNSIWGGERGQCISSLISPTILRLPLGVQLLHVDHHTAVVIAQLHQLIYLRLMKIARQRATQRNVDWLLWNARRRHTKP